MSRRNHAFLVGVGRVAASTICLPRAVIAARSNSAVPSDLRVSPVHQFHDRVVGRALTGRQRFFDDDYCPSFSAPSGASESLEIIVSSPAAASSSVMKAHAVTTAQQPAIIALSRHSPLLSSVAVGCLLVFASFALSLHFQHHEANHPKCRILRDQHEAGR